MDIAEDLLNMQKVAYSHKRRLPSGTKKAKLANISPITWADDQRCPSALRSIWQTVWDKTPVMSLELCPQESRPSFKKWHLRTWLYWQAESGWIKSNWDETIRVDSNPMIYDPVKEGSWSRSMKEDSLVKTVELGCREPEGFWDYQNPTGVRQVLA